MSERVLVKIDSWEATEKRPAGDIRAWVTPDPVPPLRSALPSMQQFGDFLDEKMAFRQRRRAGDQLARLVMGDETADPVRHPEGRDDPEEYADDDRRVDQGEQLRCAGRSSWTRRMTACPDGSAPG